MSFDKVFLWAGFGLLVFALSLPPDQTTLADEEDQNVTCGAIAGTCDDGCNADRTPPFCSHWWTTFCLQGMQGGVDCGNCACQPVSFECNCMK